MLERSDLVRSMPPKWCISNFNEVDTKSIIATEPGFTAEVLDSMPQEIAPSDIAATAVEIAGYRYPLPNNASVAQAVVFQSVPGPNALGIPRGLDVRREAR